VESLLCFSPPTVETLDTSLIESCKASLTRKRPLSCYSGDMTEWPKEDKIQGRKPYKYSVYKSPVKYIHKRKWWQKEMKPCYLIAPEIGMSQSVDKHVWKNGILDTLFDGPEMEAEIARVATLMYDVS